MLMTLFHSLAAKLTGTFVVFGGIVGAGTELTGSSPRSVFNTLLNIIGAGAAFIAYNLYQRIVKGDTPSTEISAEVREVVLDLKEVVVELRGALLHNRRDSDPPTQLDSRPEKTS